MGSPDAAVPRNAGRWISAVRHRMAQAGEHRGASAVDLVIAATAAHHGLAVLHGDADYRAIARHASDPLGRSVHDIA
ncbi:PIN domain-containing protein [Streptomyces viridochromogenes]|uniref:PIN domain-containing protein n=1 Tax=Streptomyces viridochromogenes TaxID=1938 RepID=UPI001F2D89D8|nr:PIN domain-containing protein [Streptomyces viridochromogenes]